MVLGGCYKSYIPAVELIYLQLSQPSPPKPAPANEATKKAELRRDDVVAILQRTRPATAEELEHIVANSGGYGLTANERNQVSLDLTTYLADVRQNRGRRDDPSAKFVAQTLGLLETPYGLIDRSFVEDTLHRGSQNIARCKQHGAPKCECWSAQRAIIWQAQSTHGEKSPEGWAAIRIYEALEELEVATRPDAP